MYIFIIFIVLTTIQLGFLYLKWSDIQDYKELAGEFAQVTTVNKRVWYLKTLKYVAKVLVIFKKILLIPLVVLLIINFLVSSILGGILHLII